MFPDPNKIPSIGRSMTDSSDDKSAIFQILHRKYESTTRVCHVPLNF